MNEPSRSSAFSALVHTIGDRLTAQWERSGGSGDAFAQMALDELQRAEPHRDFQPEALLDHVLVPARLPDPIASENDFGFPTMTLFRNEVLRIEGIVWPRMHVAIHDHVSPGAFVVLSGDRVQAWYDFASASPNSEAELSCGRLTVRESRHLRVGDVSPILSGDAFIHSLTTLQPLCLTMSVRLRAPTVGRSHTFFLPGLRVRRDGYAVKRMAALNTLRRAVDADAFRRFAAQCVRESVLGALLVLEQTADGDECDAWLRLAFDVHGDGARALEARVEERLRADELLEAFEGDVSDAERLRAATALGRDFAVSALET